MHVSLKCGLLDEHVQQTRRTFGCGDPDGAGESSRSSTHFDHHERVGATGLDPPRIKSTGDDRAEQRPDLGTGEEVSAAPCSAAALIETVTGVVEREAHVVGEGKKCSLAEKGAQCLGGRQRPIDSSEIGSVKCVRTLGRIPTSMVMPTVMTSDARIDAGMRIGVRSPSGISSIHITRMSRP